MMTDLEIKQGRIMAQRFKAALRDVTPEQRRAIFVDIGLEFCSCCGGDTSVCKCFDEVAASKA